MTIRSAEAMIVVHTADVGGFAGKAWSLKGTLKTEIGLSIGWNAARLTDRGRVKTPKCPGLI